MRKILSLTIIATIYIGCSGSNGDEVPTQEVLQNDLKTIMAPTIAKNVVVKPDTTIQDSTISNSTTTKE